jgi:hypothetical protein
MSPAPSWSKLVEAADELLLLGYVQIDPRGAELLFQIITEREERASIVLRARKIIAVGGHPVVEVETPARASPRC